jgi:AraC-like DNA-binding protein
LEKLLPTGSVDLVIRLNEERICIFDDTCQRRFEFDHAVIHGAHSKPCVIETKQQSAVIGVHFRPGGAAALFSVPLGELTNLAVAAEDLWGRQLLGLREQLLEARSPAAMFKLLEAALIRRLSSPTSEMYTIGRALDQFMDSPTVVRVRQIREATGYTPKRFIRLFENYVGLTPKVFCRVRRFQAVLEQISAQRNVNWTHVALDCGYFDQSHLIRDFREFSGVCPSQYRPVELDRINHVAVSP